MSALPPKISVVIPFFRPGERLRRTLESVAASTHDNLEVFMIDDAGGDGSGSFARDFAARDPRFKVLCNDANMGVSRSRNRGIEAATGDYLAFVDSDDRIAPGWLAGLLQAAREQHADIVIGKAKRVSEAGEADYPMAGLNGSGVIPFASIILKDNAVVWNKLYSAHLVREHHLRFEATLDIGEDLLFNYLAMRVAQRIYYCDCGFYYYSAGSPNSVMQTSNADARVRNFTRLLSLLSEYERQAGFRRHRKVLKKVAKDILRSHYATETTAALPPAIRRAIRRLDLTLPERVRIHACVKRLKQAGLRGVALT